MLEQEPLDAVQTYHEHSGKHTKRKPPRSPLRLRAEQALIVGVGHFGFPSKLFSEMFVRFRAAFARLQIRVGGSTIVH